MAAPVRLPHGAVVTAIRVFYATDANFDFPVEVQLVQTRMFNGVGIAMATLLSPDHTNAGVYNMATTSVSDANINNTTFAYWVYAGLESFCTDTQIGCDPAAVQGVVISYTKEID